MPVPPAYQTQFLPHAPPETHSLLPHFCTQRQLVQLRPRFAPSGIVILKDGNETFVMRWLKQMGHFMDDNILQQIFRLLHQFSIKTNVASAMITTPPFGLHTLQKIICN